MDFNKIKAIGLEYAEKGKNAAMDLAEKGKTQALLVNEQGKLLKAQRQLGALVYSLAKGKEENQPLVDKYIEMIDTIEQEITRLKATLTPAEAAEVNYEAPMEEAEEAAPEQPAQPARKTCPQCGAPSRTMHCSAISAAHSCKPVTGKSCNRAVSPTGHRPVFVKSAENHEKCWKIAAFCLKNRNSCGTIYSIFSKGDGTCAGLEPTAALYGGAAAAGDPHPAGPGKRLPVG